MSVLIRKTALLAFTMLFAQTTIANAETILYCQTELATGIYKENGRWRTSDFEPQRYTVKFDDDFSSVRGFLLFDTDAVMKCEVPLEYATPEFIQCSGFFSSLTFNKKTQHFVLFQGSVGGYTNNIPDPDTETLRAGTCEKF